MNKVNLSPSIPAGFPRFSIQAFSYSLLTLYLGGLFHFFHYFKGHLKVFPLYHTTTVIMCLFSPSPFCRSLWKRNLSTYLYRCPHFPVLLDILFLTFTAPCLTYIVFMCSIYCTPELLYILSHTYFLLTFFFYLRHMFYHLSLYFLSVCLYICKSFFNCPYFP